MHMWGRGYAPLNPPVHSVLSCYSPRLNTQAFPDVKPESPSRDAVAGSVNPGNGRPAQLAKNALVILALACITYFFANGFDKRARGTDFPDFYTAARMVLEGQGHQLYNFQVQDQFQIRYVGRTGTYYIHPPFETLLYLPFSLESLPTAYWLWCFFNAAALAYTAILFQRHVLHRWDWRVLLLLFFLFPPVLLDFLQGQDSLLLLLLITLAMVALKRDRNFRAGCLLACGLFKFHLILALLVLLAVLLTSLKRKKLIGGFVSVTIIMLLISASISGWGFVTEYPRFLMKLGSLPMGGIHPAQMANLRGLITVSGLVQSPSILLALTMSFSILLFLFAGIFLADGKLELADSETLFFGNFVLVAILVSFHLSPHDLCIALLPIGLLSECVLSDAGIPLWKRLSLLSCLCVFYLPPLHVILLARHVYAYAAIPILLIFFLAARGLGRPQPETPA